MDPDEPKFLRSCGKFSAAAKVEQLRPLKVQPAAPQQFRGVARPSPSISVVSHGRTLPFRRNFPPGIELPRVNTGRPWNLCCRKSATRSRPRKWRGPTPAPDGPLITDCITPSARPRSPSSQQPVGQGAYELHPVALTEMRRELFGMLAGSAAEAAIGEACLTAIDEVRDEHGPAPFEPRHPDIASGRPWPLAAR
jgi:hypothetical protein